LSEIPRKRVLVADSDEIVAFIASHILTRYDFAVDTVGSAEAFRAQGNSYDAVVVSAGLAAELGQDDFDVSRAIVIGDGVDAAKAFAHLRKPLELDLLVTTVSACAGRR